MQIRYFSDLHLEFYRNDLLLSEADTLLLAGDICRATDLVNWQQSLQARDRRDDIMWLFDNALEKFGNIIYCMGNHEHFDFDFYETCEALKYHLPDEIHILDKEHVEIGNLIFFGATLWTSFNNGDLDEMANAWERLPDYKYIKAGMDRLIPEIVIKDHELTLRNLSHTAKSNPDKTIIVTTHHAPSYFGLNEQFSDNGLEYAFATDLHNFIKEHDNIRHWIFGHTHMQKEFQVGNCHLATNCRGYPEIEHSARTFSPDQYFNHNSRAA